MATIEERSAAEKKRLGKSITKTLEIIAPHIEKLELQIKETRRMPFNTPKQKDKLLKRLNEIVEAFLSKMEDELSTTLQAHYLRALNKDVQGAAQERGKAVQKKRFRKDRVSKQLDLEFVFDGMRRVVRSIPQAELEYHRRKLAIENLFATEG